MSTNISSIRVLLSPSKQGPRGSSHQPACRDPGVPATVYTHIHGLYWFSTEDKEEAEKSVLETV